MAKSEFRPHNSEIAELILTKLEILNYVLKELYGTLQASLARHTTILKA